MPMALPLKSLKTRTALAIASVVVVTLVINAVYLILRKKSELRGDIERETTTFAELTKERLATGWDRYHDESVSRFPELVRDALRLNTDVERILIVDVYGRILFDSIDLDALEPRRPPSAPDRWILEPARLAAIQGVDNRVFASHDAAGEPGLEIVAPYLEEWGKHRVT